VGASILIHFITGVLYPIPLNRYSIRLPETRLILKLTYEVVEGFCLNRCFEMDGGAVGGFARGCSVIVLSQDLVTNYGSRHLTKTGLLSLLVMLIFLVTQDRCWLYLVNWQCITEDLNIR